MHKNELKKKALKNKTCVHICISRWSTGGRPISLLSGSAALHSGARRANALRLPIKPSVV